MQNSAMLLLDNPTMLLIIIVAFAAVVLVAVFAFRRGGLIAKIRGPGGTGVEVDGSNRPDPAVVGEELDAEGNIRAVDRTGRGATLRKAKSRKDIEVSASPPKQEPHPKG